MIIPRTTWKTSIDILSQIISYAKGCMEHNKKHWQWHVYIWCCQNRTIPICKASKEAWLIILSLHNCLRNEIFYCHWLTTATTNLSGISQDASSWDWFNKGINLCCGNHNTWITVNNSIIGFDLKILYTSDHMALYTRGFLFNHIILRL